MDHPRTIAGRYVAHRDRIYAVWTPGFTGVVTGYQTFLYHCKVKGTGQWKKNCSGQRFQSYEEAHRAVRAKRQQQPGDQAAAAAGPPQGRPEQQAAAAAGPAVARERAPRTDAAREAAVRARKERQRAAAARIKARSLRVEPQGGY